MGASFNISVSQLLIRHVRITVASSVSFQLGNLINRRSELCLTTHARMSVQVKVGTESYKPRMNSQAFAQQQAF